MIDLDIQDVHNAERMKGIKKGLAYRPKRIKIGLGGVAIKVGDTVEYQDLCVLSYPEEGN